VAFIQAGIVGVRLPALREAALILQPGDVALMSEDGVKPGHRSLLLATRYLGSCG
jgi:hypothetical protein